MAYVELAIIYCSLAIVFVLMTVILLKKSLNLINKVFASSTVLYGIFCVIMAIRRLEIFGPFDQDLALSFFTILLFALAPLGIMFSSYMIMQGEYLLKSPVLWGFSFIFVISEMLIWFFLYIFPLFTEPFNAAFFGLLVNVFGIVPLVPAGYQYIKLLRETDEFRTQILILLFGLILAIFGIVLFGVLIFMNNTTLLSFSLVVSITGLLIIVISFVYRPPTHSGEEK